MRVGESILGAMPSRSAGSEVGGGGEPCVGGME